MRFMEWFFGAIVVATLAILVFVIYLVVTDDSPSCRDLGGKTVLTHFVPVGKVMIPFYRCEVPK